jgi:hypothetical protein
MSVRLVLRLGFALGTLAPTAQAAETVYLVGTASSRDCVPQFATIQAAIDAASGNAADTTTIRIQGNETYLEDLDISSKHVRLVGTSSCQFVGAFARPVISGAGGAARSIVNISGEARRIGFEKLVLQRGDELQNNVSYGGAIDISGGAHSVELTEVQLDHSEAGLGGAISVRGPAQPGGRVRKPRSSTSIRTSRSRTTPSPSPVAGCTAAMPTFSSAALALPSSATRPAATVAACIWTTASPTSRRSAQAMRRCFG